MILLTGGDNGPNIPTATAKSGEIACYVRLTNRASPLNSARFAKQHFLRILMADQPQKPGHERPLSPHLTIYRWQVTMLASITHRVTGIALSVGTLVLAWWLVSVSNGPEGYDGFMSVVATPIGLVILFGFVWSLSFHLFNGIRHLAWDLGYGFNKATATQTGSLVYILSLAAAIGIYAFVWSGHAGYLR